MAGAQQNEEKLAAQLIEQFKIEPTVLLDAPTEPNEETTEPIIPASNSNAVQFTQRPKYSSAYNPMHERRKKAIKAIYQFLDEEKLNQTLDQLLQETFRDLHLCISPYQTQQILKQSNHLPERPIQISRSVTRSTRSA